MSELSCKNLSIVRGGQTLVSGATVEFPSHQIIGLLGTQDSGVYPLLRALNRMLELDGPIEVSGQVYYKGEEVYHHKKGPHEIRQMVVTVPAKPLPLPGSVYDHVATALRLRGWSRQIDIAERVEKAMESVHLWRDLKSSLTRPAASLEPELLPRLALATAIAARPTHILWADPGAGLDPVELDLLYGSIGNLSSDYTFIIATTSLQRLARLSDVTVFMKQGKIIEVGPTPLLLERPSERETELFITEQFDEEG